MDIKITRRIHLLHIIAILLMVGINPCVVTTSAAIEDISMVAKTEVGSEPNSPTRPEGWSEESHSNEAEPNYEVVFPEDKVNQITITITQEDWDAFGKLRPPEIS